MKYGRLIRIAVSLILLVYLFYSFVDLNKFFDVLKTIDIIYYILAYLLALFGLLISTFRWKRILYFNKQHVKFSQLTKLYFIGEFYNLVIPGAISGDIVRGYKTSRRKGDRIKLFTSVFLERITGLIALLLIMVFSIIFLRGYLSSIIILELIAFALITFFGLIMITSEKFDHLLLKIAKVKFLKKFSLEDKIKKITETINTLKNKRLLLETISYSLFFILLTILTTYFLARSVGVTIPLLFLIGIIPITRLITMLPISFGGIGVRESLFVYFFAFVGVSAEVAITIGLIGFILRILNATIGGVLDVTE